MNIANGETTWYAYDIKEGTLQRYVEPQQEEKKGKDIYFFLAIVFALIALIAILVVFALFGLNNRLRKKNEKIAQEAAVQYKKGYEMIIKFITSFPSKSANFS